MKYQFFDFILDCKKQALFHSKNGLEVEIDITKINYQVLMFFIQHQSQVVTKDQIIEAVWKGKMVTDNSIDQSISKIRKSLAEFDDRTLIKTVYGKGLEFTPTVKNIDDVEPTDNVINHIKPTNNLKKWSIWAAVTSVFLIFVWQFLPLLVNPTQAKKQTPIVWLSHADNNDWLNQSSYLLFNQVYNLTGENYLLDAEDKPEQISDQQYIENYWRINPKLKVITTDLSLDENLYTLIVDVTTATDVFSEVFESAELLTVLNDSNLWLINENHLAGEQLNNHNLLPRDPHVLELYMRSIYALGKGELDQSLNYVQLAIDQEPNFDLAWLHLAKTQYIQGNNEISLATLDLLEDSVFYDLYEVTAQSLRGDILDTSGQYQKAIEIYQQLLLKYPNHNDKNLLAVKFNLSYPLATELRYQEALEVLDQVSNALSDQLDMDLLAHTWHKKGSILLQIGQTESAKVAADQAYQYFNDLSDTMSSAKVNILLARIANHESNYQQAADYLLQTIGTYRQADFKLGIGAALNELIFTLVVNGQFTQAWEHMQEMREIALGIDYFAMRMAAKEFEIEISRHRQQWQQAENHLAEYTRLAVDNEFTRGLFKKQLFELDLALDQEQAGRAQPIIKTLQQQIEENGEARLQPRLNVQQARVYFLQSNADKAIELLNQTKLIALETQDGETIHSINNELLKHYLEIQDYSAAQTILDRIEDNENQPLAYPYLLLKSKILLATGDTTGAKKAAQKCKKLANEFWRTEDQRYLSGF